MRASLALAISSALTATFALSPAAAQSDARAQNAPAQTDPAAKGDGAAKSDHTAIPERDVKTILSVLVSEWRDFDKCDRKKLCSVSFESYGVALTFNDGTIVPFAHMQRNTASPHDCIVNARAALAGGDRGLAVQWVMASYLHDVTFRNWLADHPDAVVAALRRCCY
jgi:hypothetical protein